MIHKNGETHRGEVKAGSNLVVRAGIRQFPYPHLAYKWRHGDLRHLRQPGSRLGRSIWSRRTGKSRSGSATGSTTGYRLICQLWVQHDIEIAQDLTGRAERMFSCNDKRCMRIATMFVILTTKPGVFKTEISDGVVPVESYDYIFYGRKRANFTIAELAKDGARITIVEDEPPQIVNSVPSQAVREVRQPSRRRAGSSAR